MSEQNDVALLEALGGDCAGAVSIGPAVESEVEESTVQWLSEDELAGLLADLPWRPLLGVLPRDVVNAAGRWLAAEGAVGSVCVVVVEPV